VSSACTAGVEKWNVAEDMAAPAAPAGDAALDFSASRGEGRAGEARETSSAGAWRAVDRCSPNIY